MENEKLLGIAYVKLSDPEKNRRINELIRADSFRLKLYKEARFMVKSDRRCKDSRHLLILKSQPYSQATGEQTNTEFFVLVDGDGEVRIEKLGEKSFNVEGTAMGDSTVWTLNADSSLHTLGYRLRCSDAIIEGQQSNCFRKTVNKKFRLRCDGLTLISADSTGWLEI